LMDEPIDWLARLSAPGHVDRAVAAAAAKAAGDALLARYAALVERRATREPLQYIVGTAPFRYLELAVGPGVFIPRPETETVVQEALDWITRQGLYSPRVVDLCAGSGAIGLAIATEVPGAQVWGVELSPDAARWAMRNVERTAARFPDIAANYHLEVGDATGMMTLAQLDGTVDVVISNPPYVPERDVPEQPEVRDWDPDSALYGGSADGMLIPERIIMRAHTLLRPGGLFVMEHDVTQATRTVAFAQANAFRDVRTGYDLTGRPRYLVATK
ncbi:MAG: peptide chain release factor N(5)-glutamine methyltransferase, partial [Bifidobacterium sp.]|nr:peptide chain release factor N(5)-glutamine methyltransferase [Bifidobacterium sp.]